MKDKILDFLSWAILNSEDFMLMSTMILLTVFMIVGMTFSLITNFIATLWAIGGILLGLIGIGIVVGSLVAFVKFKNAAFFWAIEQNEKAKHRKINK